MVSAIGLEANTGCSNDSKAVLGRIVVYHFITRINIVVVFIIIVVIIVILVIVFVVTI